MDSLFKGLTLDKGIVNALKENKITNISRPQSEFGLRKYRARVDLADNEVFTYLGSLIYIHLECGDIVAFRANDVKNSIVTWFDVKDGVKEHVHGQSTGDEMQYDDPKYSEKERFQGIINEKILSIKVFTRKQPENIKNFIDSDEIAILFESAKSNMLLAFRGNFKYKTVMPVLKLEEAPEGFFDGTEIIEL